MISRICYIKKLQTTKIRDGDRASDPINSVIAHTRIYNAQFVINGANAAHNGCARKTAGNVVKCDFLFVPTARIFFLSAKKKKRKKRKEKNRWREAIECRFDSQPAHRPQIYPG